MSARVLPQTEILVVGGGPAGSTSAALLAAQGFEVTLLERDCFPRYHIGESLLPSLLPILDLLGAREAVEEQGFVHKSGAYYDWGGQQWSLRFGRLDQAGYSFQVVRSAFDQVLLQHARSRGVQVWEGTTVRGISFEQGRAARAGFVSGDGGSGTISFRHLVDCSGRAGLLASRQLRTRRFHDVFRNVATWGYWRRAARVQQAPEGAICIFSLPDHGWFWAIPLHDQTVSVGLVTDKRSFAAARRELGSVEAVYAACLGDAPALARMLGDAERVGGLRTESDYSYVADRFCGPGYYLAGDAACFLDPLLSTGVHLAMYSGLLAAASIAAVHRGEVDEGDARAFYQTAYQHAYERLLILVGAFYDIHHGRDAYFRHAQQLSHRDQQGLRLHESFLHIISGIEDLHDAQHSPVDVLFDRLQTPLHGRPPTGLGGHGTSLMTPWPTTPTHAAAGHYLTLEPHLGLRRAP
ncbi:NAD(P)/FAD-dependent oxidoreductase [Streptomyces sp. NPDC059008]|uniref:NAD(P)/FAD-dependent oxidoreductase n=1 Tax=Streptomyces sp. NPDC059008 TaxID=3346693 RepID=UPI00367D3036